MGFGGAPPGAGNPYMMGFQGGMPRQMPAVPQQNQYMTNHRQPPVNMPNQQMPQQQQPQQQVQQQQPVWNQTVAAVPVISAAAKRKLTNDPNRPKRPTSAYFYFVQVEREEAAKRGEKITRVAEWTKQISVKWRELTVEQKEIFQKMAATDKQRYVQQMAVYTGKDVNRPKRPQSAYFLWLADFRVRMKDKFVENRDILRAAGEEWRKLTTVAKAPYEQRAEEERRKYEQAMKDYNLTGGVKKPRPDEPLMSAPTTTTPLAAAAAATATGSQPVATAATALPPTTSTYQLPPMQLNPLPPPSQIIANPAQMMPLQQQPQAQVQAQAQAQAQQAKVEDSTDKDSDESSDGEDCSGDSDESDE